MVGARFARYVLSDRAAFALIFGNFYHLSVQ